MLLQIGDCKLKLLRLGAVFPYMGWLDAVLSNLSIANFGPHNIHNQRICCPHYIQITPFGKFSDAKQGPRSFQACFCNLVVGPWHHMTPSDYCQLTSQMWRFQTQEASTFKHQGDVCWHGKILVGKFKFSTFAIYGTGNVSFYRDLAIRRHIMPPSAVFGAKYHFSSSSTKTPPRTLT